VITFIQHTEPLCLCCSSVGWSCSITL